MLPAGHRLRRSDDFQRAVRRGDRRGSATLVVHHVPLIDQSAPLVGFAVGKSVGGAVTRNKVKRRLRHLMRDRVGLLAPCLLVVRATSEAADVPSSRLAVDLDDCLARLGAARQ